MSSPASPKPVGAGSPKKSADVVSRLTDTSKYTGAHKQRFDETGKGRGLAGRETVVEFKGNTNTAPIEKSGPAAGGAGPRKPVVSVPLGAQKFGVQADKAVTVKLFRNGDKHHNGEVFTLKLLKSFDQVLDKASVLVKLPTGAVRKIYKKDMKHTIKSIEEFEDGASYLCCGGEKPAEVDKQSVKFLA